MREKLLEVINKIKSFGKPDEETKVETDAIDKRLERIKQTQERIREAQERQAARIRLLEIKGSPRG